jgi:two-component system response regulator RstA
MTDPARPASKDPRILIVEDDLKLAELVREFLEGAGYLAAVETRGDRAAERILREQPDLVVLDLMLPGIDGLEVCRRVRPAFSGVILMLTARGEEIDEVVGLELGADDYVAKPVSPRLLLARVGSLLRRSRERELRASSEPPSRIELGALVVDVASRSASVEGRSLELTTAEFDLLWLLASHAGQVLTREQIYGHLRGISYDGLDRSIDLRIARLRKKLGDDGKQPQHIKSVRGVGYLFAVER